MTDNTTMTVSELAKAIITLANEKNVMLVLAESCTGGMIAAALTDIAGSSAVLDRGLVTYSDQAKQDLLGVSDDILASYGAVSTETAIAMTTGALLKTPAAQLAASVTGIAGPGGGSKINLLGWCILAVNGAANRRFIIITSLLATAIQFAISHCLIH